MKCTNCGKNEATFHYRTEINGEVTEVHLCADCARAIGAETGRDEFFDDILDELLGGALSGADMIAIPALVVQRARPGAEVRRPEQAVDTELSRRREINALRESMNEAAAAEDYEKAARLRDRLRELEKGPDGK